MKPPTKNVLTRESLAKELRVLNAADIRGAWTQFCIAAPFLLLTLFLSGYGFKGTRYPIGTTLIASIAVVISLWAFYLLIREICLAYAERKKLAAGEFRLTHRTLFSKREKFVYRRSASHVEELFSFEEFGEVVVGHTEYQLASPGDEYYIVSYPNEKRMKLFYSCKRYEYREK